MAWQCFTWPVVEMGGHWVNNEYEAELTLRVPVERPPTAGEVVVRGMACTESLLLGVAVMRVLRSKKAG
jgi:hypothetical protein